jgi:MFS family permease
MSRADRIFNFAACWIDATGFPLGAAFFSTTTILPVFLRHLGASNAVIGCLSALMSLMLLLPGLLTVGHIQRLARVRGYLIGLALVERAALLPLVPLTLAWGETHPTRLIALLFVCLAAHTAAMGLNLPAYWVIIGKTIPARWRGRLYGYAGGVGGLLGIGIDWVLRNAVLSGPGGGFPRGFSNGFLIGFLLLTASVLPLGLIREPAETAPPPDRDSPARHPLRDSRRVWRDDPGFRRFLLAQIAFSLAVLATPFFVLYARRDLLAGPAAIAGYTATTIIVSAFGSLVWGALADRSGNKRVLLAAAICALLAALSALAAPDPRLFYGVFLLSSLAAAGTSLAGNNIVMEFAGASREIPLYSVLYNLAVALPRAAAPLLGGLIADRAGYRPLFVLSLLLALAACALTARVHEPRT